MYMCVTGGSILPSQARRVISYVHVCYWGSILPSQARRVNSYVHVCYWGINFACFYNFAIGFWNCSKSVVFFFFINLLSPSLLPAFQ